MASYRRGNWQADFKINLAMYGADTAGLDFGRNVLIPYGNYVNEFDNDIGQGLKTHLTTTGATLSYLLNRRTNLRIEAGTVLRNETCDLFIKKTTLFFFGIRTGLRNLYNDF
jgi:hypothetical protein